MNTENTTMKLTYEAWRITYQSSEQAARAAFERMMELKSSKCLHQIAEPAAQGLDAARYHWLREQHDKGDDSVTIFIGDEQHGPGHLDAQIDEAIAAQAKQGGA